MILANTSRGFFEILGKLYDMYPITTIVTIVYLIFCAFLCVAAIYEVFAPKKDEGGWGWWDGPGVY